MNRLKVALVAVAVGALTAGSLAACSNSNGQATDNSDPAVVSAANQMATAVRDRLAVMPDVAFIKYETRASVEDPARETAVTTAFVKDATAQKIPADVATAVIKAQIEAAKRVQRSLIQKWGTGVAPVPEGSPKNLDKDLRPQIDTATKSLLDGMVAFQNVAAPADWPAQLTAAAQTVVKTLPDGVSDTDYDFALVPLGLWRKGGAPAGPPAPPPAPTPTKKPKPKPSNSDDE